MITSISKSTRTLCSSIFVSFLLEYPLEAERVSSHFNHLLKNLGYFDSDGRLIVLDVLHLLAEKFPVEILDHYAELLFFTLVLRSANEVHKDCKARVSDVIKKLIQKVSPPKAKTLFNTVCKMGSEDPVKRELILASKLYVFGLFIEADSKGLKTNDLKMIVECSLSTMKRNEKILHETILKRQASFSKEVREEEAGIRLEAKKFLAGIDLYSEEDIEAPDGQIGDEEETEKWSSLYLSIVNLDKIL
jgi:hypothetical protein